MKKRNGAALRMQSRVIACGSAKERASTWAFTGEAKNIEEHRLGSLFLVGEIDPEGDEHIPSVLPMVGSKFKQEYYTKPRRRALASFAEALKSTNAVFAHIPKKRNPMWLGKVHLAAGAFSESMFYFSLVGKIRAYLFRGPNTIDLTRRFLAEGRPHPTRLFRHVASGGLVAGDRLFFATPKIFTSLFLEDVRHIVRETALEEIPQQIEMLYSAREARGGLYFVVLETQHDQPRRPPPPQSQPFRLDQRTDFARKFAAIAKRFRRAGLLWAAFSKSARLRAANARNRLEERGFGAALGWLSGPRRLYVAAAAVGVVLIALLLIFSREIIL